MIRECSSADSGEIVAIINDASAKYRGVIPSDCWHEPYFSAEQLQAEIAAGVRFIGYEKDGVLAGIMGVQNVRDATLIRHAYVRKEFQGHGIGGELLRRLASNTKGRLLVGTWAAATWAIQFYERNGLRLSGAGETAELLRSYWTIPERQRETSVVLEYL